MRMSEFFYKIKMPAWTKIDHHHHHHHHDASHPADATTPLLSDSVSAGSDSGLSTVVSRPPRPLEPGRSHGGPGRSPGATSGGGGGGGGYFHDGPAWSDPLGRPSRGDNDEHLLMFRRAVGINSDLAPFPPPGQDQRALLEQGRSRTPTALGIYGTVLRQERRQRLLHHAVGGMVWGCHGLQIVLGATLACLGLNAQGNAAAITVLGAANTVVAGVLALVKGKDLPERLGRAEADFRQLKVWIEETESLLALGVIGSDRREVGALIQTAFRRFNVCSGRAFDFEAAVDGDVDSFGLEDDGDNEAGYI